MSLLKWSILLNLSELPEVASPAEPPCEPPEMASPAEPPFHVSPLKELQKGAFPGTPNQHPLGDRWAPLVLL